MITLLFEVEILNYFKIPIDQEISEEITLISEFLDHFLDAMAKIRRMFLMYFVED